MFTTLKLLKESPAQRERVAKVERWLLSQNPQWTDTCVLPIFAIANSNPVEDVAWVVYNNTVHYEWPEMAEKISYDPSQHMEDYISKMNRSKAKTVKELTDLYNDTYAQCYPNQSNDPNKQMKLESESTKENTDENVAKAVESLEEQTTQEQPNPKSLGQTPEVQPTLIQGNGTTH